MKSALCVTLIVASIVGIVAACSVDVDLAGKGCPCPSGLLCDTSTNTCVTSLPPASASDAGPPPPACNGEDCKCTKNEDCRDPKRPYCGGGICVECLATPSDTCTAGGYCNEQNQCVLGCKGDGDCQTTGQKCNTSSHRCVDCVVDGDCTAAGPNAKCSPSGKCADVCTGENTPCGTN